MIITMRKSLTKEEKRNKLTGQNETTIICEPAPDFRAFHLTIITLIILVLDILVTKLEAQMSTIIHYASVINMYAVCPFMLVLFLRKCRVKNTSKEL